MRKEKNKQSFQLSKPIDKNQLKFTEEKFEQNMKVQHQLKKFKKIRQKNVNDSLLNPYLIFHSPFSSEKSPFRKQIKNGNSQKNQKSTKSLRNIKDYSQRDNQTIQVVGFNKNLVFTEVDKEKQKTRNIGMIMVSKSNWENKQTLIYDTNLHTVVLVPKCKKCQKVFQNHQALGGHMRLCKQLLNKYKK